MADHGPNIKDDDQYEALRDHGMSKSKAAAIANPPKKETAKKGGASPPYENWTKEKLDERARKLDISGYSRMNKGELINTLRSQ